MDKLLIVDDEEIEREGIASLIDWPQYGVEVAGTAWNGIDGKWNNCARILYWLTSKCPA
jgi:YesN/AraC family two-component response regulator